MQMDALLFQPINAHFLHWMDGEPSSAKNDFISWEATVQYIRKKKKTHAFIQCPEMINGAVWTNRSSEFMQVTAPVRRKLSEEFKKKQSNMRPILKIKACLICLLILDKKDEIVCQFARMLPATPAA